MDAFCAAIRKWPITGIQKAVVFFKVKKLSNGNIIYYIPYSCSKHGSDKCLFFH